VTLPSDDILKALAMAVSDDAILMCAKFAYARGHTDLAAEMLMLMQIPASMEDVKILAYFNRDDIT